MLNLKLTWGCSSVADPDPYVFRPPGSRSVSQWYGSELDSRLLLSSKDSKKNLDSCCFVTSL
jgi:hypothetical protein